VKPRPAEVDAWRPSFGPCCSVENFRPDFNSTALSPWNKSAAKVFVEAFMRSDIPEAHGADPESVRSLFVSRLRSMREDIRRSADSPMKRLIAQRNRRRERKKWIFKLNSAQLYYRRIEAARSYPETERFIRILREYGIDGMSSDESDHEHNGTGHYQYRVKLVRWRNPGATQCFRILDCLHRNRKFRPTRRARPGSQPHQRLVSNLVSDRPPVPRLSVGMYDARWLRSQPQWMMHDLQPLETGDPVDFSHHISAIE
ncbi:hypothetical protein FA13DRAFT_1641036, partial [Coprinellus micaceus]